MMKLKWMEIRPVLGAEIKPGQMTNVINLLHNTDEEFTFLIKIEREGEERKVRFLLGVGANHSGSIKRSVGTALGAEVLDAQAPSIDSPYYTEMHLGTRSVIPIFPHGETAETNPVDDLVHALEEHDVSMALMAKADFSATAKHHNWLVEKYGVKPSFRKELVSQTGALATSIWKSPDPMVHGADKAIETGRKLVEMGAERDKAKTKSIKGSDQVTRHVEKRMMENLFDVDIVLAGASRRDVLTVSSRFPSYGLNSLVPYAVKRSFKRGKAVNWQRKIGKELWKVLPIVALVGEYFVGFFNPLHLLNGLSLQDLASFVLPMFLAVFLGYYFRSYNSIIMSSVELGLLINLPTDITNISVIKGATAQQRSGMIQVSRFGEMATKPGEE